MRGTIARKGSRWYPVVDVGRDAKGHRRRRWGKGQTTRKAASKALTEMLGALDNGSYVERSRDTVADYLQATWLPAIATTVRATTLRSYEMHVRVHVVPRIGHLPLQGVGGPTLNAFYTELSAKGRERGGGLSAATVRRVHSVLHRAFRDAVKWNLLVRNPADAADPPRARAAKAAERPTWTAPQVGAFLAHVAGNRLAGAWTLAATTGMRRREVLGLRWSDVDLDGASLSIRQTLVAVGYELQISDPKTRRGRRNVALDATTVAALRTHRASQARERLVAGGAWTDSGLVFTDALGRPVHPDSFTKAFGRHLRAAGLPTIRLHDVRHSYCTLALEAGVDAKTVSDRVGHASVAFTQDSYTHAVPSLATQAAERVERLIFGGGES